MRLHRLAMTGFGPFRDEQVVDFEALTAPGLFLLSGDTGAGKSSVLDAVAYALYGRVAGSRASATRIRSDHADPERPTVVELELTLRGRRLRVRRSPEWSRRKVRGTGTTKQPTKVLLELLHDGEWQVVSYRADEVGHELGELLGMNHQQFCQVVLLPQGDFAQFLHADAETRKRLLERLFGTERFSAVEGWLVERRRERGQELTTADREIHATVARLAEVTGDPEPPGPDDPSAMARWAERQVAGVDAAQAEAGALLATARSARSAADLRLAGQTALAERQQRLRGLQDRATALAGSAARIDLVRRELTAARRAGGLGVLLDAVTTAADTAADARAEATARVRDASRRTAGTGAAARLLDLESKRPSTRSASSLEQLEREVRAEITRLEPLVDDETRLLALAAERSDAEDTVADLEADAAGHQAWLTEAPGRIAALSERRDTLAMIIRDAPVQREEHDRLGPSIEAARARDRLGEALDAAARLRRDAVDAAQRARQTWQDLRERRLAAMAGELAAALTDGAPCPVCGATEHPAPAESASAAVEDADRENKALSEFEQAEHTREAASAHKDDAATALQAATVAAGGAEPPAALLARRTALAERLSVAAGAVIELEVADRDVQRLARDLDERRDALTAVTAAHGRAVQRAAGLQESASGLRQAIDAARHCDATVTARIARLATAVEAMLAARQAVLRAVAADADLASQVGAAEGSAADAGFPDLRAATDARRADEVVAALAAEIQSHDDETVLVASGLASADLDDIRLDPIAEPARARLEVALAAEAAEHASARAGELTASAMSAARLAVQLDRQLRARRPLQQAFATVDGLSRLAEGTNSENRLRMRLSYFVLSARLEQVAAAASVRLLRMTDGRFSLVHTDDRAAGNQRSGLGLAVRDAWYGTTRDPSTLSGGESFMASLALALGLADVVVAEAGGAFMDTLFVDEGFGSLDEATLDAVLDVLDGLREGGRAVGLVSHVGELRQRVPTQLTVRRERTGSTLTFSA